MADEESRRCVEILTFTTNLEHIGDIIDKNLMELAAKKIQQPHCASRAEGSREIRAFHERVMDNLQLALNVFMLARPALARRLLAEKARSASCRARRRRKPFRAAARAAGPRAIETSALHLDVCATSSASTAT